MTKLLQKILLPQFNTTQHAQNGRFAVAIFIIKNRGPPPAFDCFDSPTILATFLKTPFKDEFFTELGHRRLRRRNFGEVRTASADLQVGIFTPGLLPNGVFRTFPPTLLPRSNLVYTLSTLLANSIACPHPRPLSRNLLWPSDY